MILEAIVTTTNADQTANVAPMGPHVDGPDFDRFVLRPFHSSVTYQNLLRHGEGVLHVVDDVELLVRAAIGALDPPPPLHPATCVSGWTLDDACRWYEFRVREVDDRPPRADVTVDVVARGRVRDFFGFNRAKHAVVEAAILATRVDLIDVEEIAAEFARLWVPIRKTGGDQELRAMAVLDAYLKNAAAKQHSSRAE